jgi:FtsH-binding integral membrane protein
VLTVLGLGFEVVASSAIEELSGPVAAMGVVIIALGVGFLISAVLAYLLSRRFGLMAGEVPAHETRG